MKLRFDTEDWRELVNGWVRPAEDADVDAMADELADNVASRLRCQGFTVDRAYQQKRGAFVIFQDGAEAEQQAFADAVDAEIAIMAKSQRHGRACGCHRCNPLASDPRWTRKENYTESEP